MHSTVNAEKTSELYPLKQLFVIWISLKKEKGRPATPTSSRAQLSPLCRVSSGLLTLAGSGPGPSRCPHTPGHTETPGSSLLGSLVGDCLTPALGSVDTGLGGLRAVAMGSSCIRPTISSNSSFPGLILSPFSQIPARARPGAETDAEPLATAWGLLPTSPHLWPPHPVTSAPEPDLPSYRPSLCSSGTCRVAEQQGSATVECLALRPARESRHTAGCRDTAQGSLGPRRLPGGGGTAASGSEPPDERVLF